ncbi:ferritin-like domain-containing protein [Cohnella nanjingensis]|uniref:Ferritin-like domain-containing protein n=1 Tax=Cohnella nanjingensis TaxID=1387779 RepID=A0A7X0RZ08_9BACL|nr:ferritin-like domain-containing protein [Cohnella nanjingensis]MBB6674925.1 ferritin-like domain-containing protein [Cohnella nanjingensis]
MFTAYYPQAVYFPQGAYFPPAGDYGYRATFTPVWATSFAEATEMIKEAVQGERNDELFYDQLIRMAPDRAQADLIASIRDDERQHNRMFREMYAILTGRQVPPAANEPPERFGTYAEGLEKALMGELAAVENYRRIWFGLPPGIYRDTAYGIILDEQKHADKYNYLLGKNRT